MPSRFKGAIGFAIAAILLVFAYRFTDPSQGGGVQIPGGGGVTIHPVDARTPRDGRDSGALVVLHGFALSSEKTSYRETYDGGRTGRRLRTFRPDDSSSLEPSEPVFNLAIENAATDRSILVTRIVYHIAEDIGELGGDDLPGLLIPLATYVHGIRPLPGYHGEDGWVFTDAALDDPDANDLHAAPLLVADLQPQITIPPSSYASFDLQIFSESEPAKIDYRMRLEIATSAGSVETEEFVLVVAPHEAKPPNSWQRARIVPQTIQPPTE